MAIQAQFPSRGSQDWMDNGCGGLNNFCFNVQQQIQQFQHYQNQQQQHCSVPQLPDQLNQQWQRDQNILFDNSSLVSTATWKQNYSNNSPPMSFYLNMAALDQKQTQEMDHYIRAQDQRLRFLLQEQRKRQVALLCKTVESKALSFLRQKDEEIAQAAQRRMELEDQLRRLEIENMTWQRVAQEHEAMIVSLNNTIEQLKEKAASCYFHNGAEDAESCCDVNWEAEAEPRGAVRGLVDDDGIEKEEGDSEEQRARKLTMKQAMLCKGCNSRNSCVLFLPCRHLCSCEACEPFLHSCPVCQTAKEDRIEALI